MKLLVHGKAKPLNRFITTKMLLVMKLTAIFLLSAALHVSAAGFSQTITISKKNASLEEMFEVLQKQGGYNFIINSHMLAKAKKIAFADCLEHDFVGLNRGSSLLELTSRAATDAGRPLRLRVQVRSFDAMSQMIAARLGVGVLPLAACQEVLGPRKLKAVRLTDAWAHRRLLLGYSAERPLSAAARVMVEHLRPTQEGA